MFRPSVGHRQVVYTEEDTLYEVLSILFSVYNLTMAN